MKTQNFHHKLVVIGVFLAVFSSFTAAQGFATVTFDQDKRISGLETDFSLGLLNLDNETREVRFSTPSSSNYNVSFAENPLMLPPSEVSSSPVEDEQWYSLGDGRYASITRISFNVTVSKTSEYRNFSIPVDVNAVYGNGDSPGASQTAIQSRTHSFDLVTTSQMIEPEQENFYSDGSLFNTSDGENVDESLENSSDREVSENDSQDDLSEENVSKPEKGLTEQSQDQNEAVNEWTILFLLGTIISAALIAREIL